MFLFCIYFSEFIWRNPFGCIVFFLLFYYCGIVLVSLLVGEDVNKFFKSDEAQTNVEAGQVVRSSQLPQSKRISWNGPVLVQQQQPSRWGSSENALIAKLQQEGRA